MDLSDVEVKRLDHHGIVAGVIKDIGLVERIDDCLGFYGNETISAGQVVAGMIMNGLGFSHRSLSLSQEFFLHIPIERLLGENVTHQELNRHKLGRTLEAISDFGSSEIFSRVAGVAAIKEGIDQSRQSLDTTSFSLKGEYEHCDDDEQGAVRVTKGYSKDHRPDLKQVVTELIVSHDGSVPLILNMHDGNASDSKIFKERCCEIVKRFDGSQSLVADSKLYCKENAKNLSGIGFVTRIPETISLAKQVIIEALEREVEWYSEESDLSFSLQEQTHYDIKQNWIVCLSAEALSRARKTTEKKVSLEADSLSKNIFHFEAQSFSCKQDLRKAFEKVFKRLRFHTIEIKDIISHPVYPGRGRPAKGVQPVGEKLNVKIELQLDSTEVESYIKKKACFIIGTNKTELDAEETIRIYKEQGSVERGFRFLKDPQFFASAFYLKSPVRIEAMVCVMTMALLVYSIAQRRIRAVMEKSGDSVPDSSGKSNSRPTLSRIFQIFHGINYLYKGAKNVTNGFIQGIKDIHIKLLEALGGFALSFYSGKTPRTCSMSDYNNTSIFKRH